MTAEEIVRALERYDGTFPREALEQAIEQKEAITPHLLDALRFAREQAEDLPDDYWLHTWAMFLLAQFREARAYPLLLDLLRLSRTRLDALFGDSLLEDMGPALASVYGGDTGPTEQLVEDPAVEEVARVAGLMSLVTLVKLGLRSREETLEYFSHLLQHGQGEPGSFFWSVLVGYATELYPDLVYEEIKSAIDRNLPDPFFITLEQVDEALAEGPEAALARLAENPHYRLIDDTIGETEGWLCFRPQPVYTPPPILVPPSPPRAYAGPLQRPLPEYIEKPAPVVVGPKPGRNDPCPCGSGLKYKKCCLKGGKA